MLVWWGYRKEQIRYWSWLRLSKQTDYRQVAGRIFTEDFLIFLDTIPRSKKKAKIVSKMNHEINNILAHKQIGDCILALTFYLSCILVDNDIDFDLALNDIERFKGEYKTENYIQ